MGWCTSRCAVEDFKNTPTQFHLQHLGCTVGYVTQEWNEVFFTCHVFFYCLRLRDGSRHPTNICWWLLSSAVWLCFHHLFSLPLSLNMRIPGTSVWNNREADGSPPANQQFPGIKEPRNTVTEASSRRRTMMESVETSLKLSVLSFLALITTDTFLWLVSTSFSLFALNILTQVSKAVCKSCLLTQRPTDKHDIADRCQRGR